MEDAQNQLKQEKQALEEIQTGLKSRIAQLETEKSEAESDHCRLER